SCRPLRPPARSPYQRTTKTTLAQAATATVPNAARGARLGSMTSGSNTMQAVSAIAIWAVTANTWGPFFSPSPSITGNASAADDDAIKTAYSAACPVAKIAAMPAPSPAATAPTNAARTSAQGIAERNALSCTGTLVPTTNITSAKPTLANSTRGG